VAVAARLGLTSLAPVVLKDSHHTSIHLAPARIVARVIATDVSADAYRRLDRELGVAAHLARAGAPIVPPCTEVPPGPYFHEKLGLTLWQFVAHHPARDRDALAATGALHRAHAALASYAGALPPFAGEADACRAALEDESALPALAPADRAFLLAAHDRLRRRLAAPAVAPVALHGDPHLGNVLMTAHGPLWTDWESACRGPLEWDLSSLPDAALAAFPVVDRGLLATLRDLRSVCVAVWCWNQPERAAEKREAAQFHLRRLRQAAVANSTNRQQTVTQR